MKNEQKSSSKSKEVLQFHFHCYCGYSKKHQQIHNFCHKEQTLYEHSGSEMVKNKNILKTS